jgi:hypothetical protein
MTPSDPNPLTPQRRARLRPTVDAVALEQLLAVLPAAMHWPAILACIARPTREELAGIGVVLPELPSVDARSGAVLLSPTSYDLTLQFDDPALEALWTAVEPGLAE